MWAASWSPSWVRSYTVIMNESRKKYKFELPHNQKFNKYGEITHTDQTWTIGGSNKSLLLPQILFGGSNC